MPSSPPERSLPRRDWIIIPGLVVLTCLLMLAGAEVAARVAWPEHKLDACEITDPRLGLRFRPHCRALIKAAEGPWTLNRYNDCGYRTDEPCGPKPAAALRVALLGTSLARGYLVPYEQTFAARTAGELSRRCGRPAEFQNMGGGGGAVGLRSLPLRAEQAVRLQPDAMVLVVAPFDLQLLGRGETSSPPPPSLTTRVVQTMRQSRALLVAQSLMYRQLDVYLPLFLKHGDEADYLRRPFTPLWSRRLAEFGTILDGVAQRARAGHVPLLLVFVPLRPQAALVDWPRRPKDVDPDALGAELGRISARVGAPYLDLTEWIGRLPGAADLYYPVDTHPTAEGHAQIARALLPALDAAAPAIGHCRTEPQGRAGA